MLPARLVEQLGLREQGTVWVRYADEREEERTTAGPVTVRIGQPAMTIDCIVGPRDSEQLVGEILLEALELTAQRLEAVRGPRLTVLSSYMRRELIPVGIPADHVSVVRSRRPRSRPPGARRGLSR